MANFVFKFSHFLYHGNRVRSDVNFNIGVKLHDLVSHVWCDILGSISSISSSQVLVRVLANFVLIFPNFRYHGNRGLNSEVNFSETGKLLDL